MAWCQLGGKPLFETITGAVSEENGLQFASLSDVAILDISVL